MRKKALLLFSLLIAVCPAWSAPSAAPTEPAVRAVSEVYDFGSRSVLDLSPIAHRFVLKAGTGSPVVVDRLQPSCHCTQATPEGETDGYGRFTISAGQTFNVAVTVNPSDMAPGTVEKEVYVFVNGGSTPSVTLHIKGTITPPVVFSVPVLDFGAAAAGTAHTLSFTVTVDPHLLPPGQAARLVCSDPRLQVTPQNPATQTGTSQAFQVTIPAGMPPGKFISTLSVALPSQGQSVSGFWSVPVHGEVTRR